jgi:predicted small secreted protein
VQIDGVNGYRFNYTSKNGSDLVYSEGVTFIFVKNNKKYDFELVHIISVLMRVI